MAVNKYGFIKRDVLWMSTPAGPAKKLSRRAKSDDSGIDELTIRRSGDIGQGETRNDIDLKNQMLVRNEPLRLRQTL